MDSLDELTDGRFDDLFTLLVSTVEIPASGVIDVEHVIDTIEEADPDDLILDYNADATECRVRPRETGTHITITADGVTIEDASIAPSSLLTSAKCFIDRFFETEGPSGLKLD